MTFYHGMIMRLLFVLTKVLVFKFGSEYISELDEIEREIKMSEAGMQ